MRFARKQPLGFTLRNFQIVHDIQWKNLLSFTGDHWLDDNCINAGVDVIRVGYLIFQC
jgi:hypothetical protein